MKARKSDRESVNEVLERVPETLLLSHYMNITSLPALISSPLRSGDRHPSFFIYSPDGIKVLYKDYATGDKGDIYTLLMLLYGISFSQLIRKISSDSSLEAVVSNLDIKAYYAKGAMHERVPADIRVKVRDWEDYDIQYWSSYGIPLKWLEFAEVYPISHKIVYKEGKRYVFRAAKFAYVFVEKKEGKVSLKIYQPYSKNFKWNTNNDGSVIGLWAKMPSKGEKIVICSSLKDALCLWANTGIPAIYVQSETTGVSATAQKILKERFKNIYICFDNDAPGLKDGEELSKNTSFTNITLPKFTGGKDISDLYKIKGKKEFVKIINKMFDEQ